MPFINTAPPTTSAVAMERFELSIRWNYSAMTGSNGNSAIRLRVRKCSLTENDAVRYQLTFSPPGSNETLQHLIICKSHTAIIPGTIKFGKKQRWYWRRP